MTELPEGSWIPLWRSCRPVKVARRCVTCSEFLLATTASFAAAPLSAFIIPQILGDDSWMFERCSAR